MPDAPLPAIVDTLVDAIVLLELDRRHDTPLQRGATRYIHYGRGRSGSAFTHEFLPYAVPAEEAIRFARSTTSGSPHLICAIGEHNRIERGVYEAAGYTVSAEWTMMARPLTGRLSEPGDDRALLIEDAATESRVMTAMLAAGGSGHPTRPGHAGHPAIRQRFIAEDGVPASFGRLVILGEHAYLGDVVTLPAYRRRGHAASIVRRLLDDALAAGARDCMLASTAMAHDLYLRFGFTDALAMVEFTYQPPEGETERRIDGSTERAGQGC